MSALPPKADIAASTAALRQGPWYTASAPFTRDALFVRTSRCPEIALAVSIFTSLRLAFLDQRAIETVVGLALERA